MTYGASTEVTARARQPHLWLTQAEHELETWLLLDQTPSMAFGTVDAEKADLATTVAAAVGLLTDGPGNRLGVGVLRTDGVAWSSPLAGRIAAHRVLRTAPGPRNGTVSQTLAEALSALAVRHRRPGLRVIVSDLIDPAGAIERPFDWEAPLRRLAARHDVVVVEVVDPRELELPAVGQLVLVIPNPGGSVRLTPATAGYGPRTPAQQPSTAPPRLPRSGPLVPGMSCCGPTTTGSPNSPASSARAVVCRRAAPRGERDDLSHPDLAASAAAGRGLAAAYVVVLRRRQRYAVRFASLPMLERVVPRRPGWRRHVPATLVLLALTSLGLAAARPEMTLRFPYDRATVMVAIDTSGSMAATDVPPNRLEAAKAAAVAFVDDLPDTVNVASSPSPGAVSS